MLNLKKFQAQNIQEILNSIAEAYLWRIRIDEGEETQAKGTEKYCQIIIENFPNSKKKVPIEVQETPRTSNRLDQKWKTYHHIIIKALYV